MRWTVHSEKSLYEDEWLDIRLADVELPDGRHLEHRLIRTPPGAGCVTGQRRIAGSMVPGPGTCRSVPARWHVGQADHA
jgi:hypothetical protein